MDITINKIEFPFGARPFAKKKYRFNVFLKIYSK